MTEYNKLFYKIEDTFVLGRALPVVAMRQITKLAEQIRSLPDSPQYIQNTQNVISEDLMKFYEDNKHLMDDERALKKVFDYQCKKGMFKSSLLALFEKKYVDIICQTS